MKRIISIITKRYFVCIALFLISFFVYLKTLCPAVYWYDSGELIAACYTLGIPHPSGYPLYCLLGKLFTLIIPFGNIAFRINVMSAFFASLTVMVIYLIMRRLISSKTIAFSTSLLFAFSYTLWFQATIAEVYTLNAFFVSAVIFILITWRQKKDIRLLYLFAFIYGLGLTNHLSLFFLAPAIIYLIIITDAKIFCRSKNILVMMGLFFLALCLYLYLPMRSLSNPPVDWGDTETLKNFWYHVSGKIVREHMFNVGINQSTIIKDTCYLFLRQFSIAGLLAIIIGVWRLRKSQLLPFFLLIAIGNITYIICIATAIKTVNDFGLPSYIIAFICIGYGLQYLIMKGHLLFPKKYPYLYKYLSIPFIILIPIIPLKTNYSKNDKGGYYFAYDYGMSILNNLEPNAILFTQGDNNAFPLWYLQYVENRRTDVTLIHWGLLGCDWYLRQIEGIKSKKGSRYNTTVTEITGNKKISEIISNNIETRPLYSMDLNFNLDYLIPYGLTFKIQKDKVDLIKKNDIAKHNSLLKISNETSKDRETARVYSAVHHKLGFYFYNKNMLNEAMIEYEKALNLDPTDPEIYNNIGITYAQKGRFDEAISIFKKALRLSPAKKIKAQAYYNIGLIYSNIGEYRKAAVEYKRALKTNPYLLEAHGNLGIAYFRLGLKDKAIKEFKRVLEIDPDNKLAIENLKKIE